MGLGISDDWIFFTYFLRFFLVDLFSIKPRNDLGCGEEVKKNNRICSHNIYVYICLHHQEKVKQQICVFLIKVDVETI